MRTSYFIIFCTAFWNGVPMPTYGAAPGRSYKAALQGHSIADVVLKPAPSQATKLRYYPDKGEEHNVPVVQAARLGEPDYLTLEELQQLYQWAQGLWQPHNYGTQQAAAQTYYTIFLSITASKELKIQSCMALSKLYVHNKDFDLARQWLREAIVDGDAEPAAKLAAFKAQLLACRLPCIKSDPERVQALGTLIRTMGPQEGIPRFLVILAYLALGHNRILDKAIRTTYYKKARALAQAENARKLEIRALIGLGNIPQPGDEQCYKQAWKLAQQYENDKLKAEVLIGWGNTRTPGGLWRYKEGLRLARLCGSIKLQIKALSGLAVLCPSARLEYYQEATVLAKSLNNPRLYMKTLLKLANAHHPNRIAYYQEVIDFALAYEDKQFEAAARIGLGDAGVGSKAVRLDNYHKGLTFAKECGNIKLMIRALSGLGDTLELDQERYQRYHDGLDLALQYGYIRLASRLCIRLGNSQVKEEEADEAIKCFKEGWRLAEACHDKELQAEAWIGAGNMGVENDRECYHTAVGLALERGNDVLLARAYIGLGNTLISRIRQASAHDRPSMFEKQRKMYYNALTHAKKTERKDLVERADKAIAGSYKKEKDQNATSLSSVKRPALFRQQQQVYQHSLTQAQKTKHRALVRRAEQAAQGAYPQKKDKKVYNFSVGNRPARQAFNPYA